MVILGILTCIEVYHCLLCWLNYLSIHFWRFTKISFLQTHSNLALKHSGCCHALFTFKNVTKYFIKKGSKVYCAFLDSSKAFDKVLHNGLFVKLLKKGMSVRFVRILQKWYSQLNLPHCTGYLFNRMVLLERYLIFTAGYDKVEYYHLCCSVYTWMT